jgi:signal transduction histidine kinase
MVESTELTLKSVGAFVRQLTNDVRNRLNGLDLEATLLGELVANEEADAPLTRLRSQLRQFAADMREVAAKFEDPAIARDPVTASELFLIWKDQVPGLQPKPQVAWVEDAGDALVCVNVGAIAHVFRELLSNSVAFSDGELLRAEVHVENGQVRFTLAEQKRTPIDPSAWGRHPFTSTRRGHYGLGLWEADRAIAASEGVICRNYDAASSELVTALSFPIV